MDDPGLTSIERLKHIEEAISKIEKFCQDIDEQNFLEDEQVNSSVLYQFIVIGEAVRFVNPEILKKYPYMEIEIGSHTDSRGSFRYNEALGIRRANSTYEYLVSRGVNPNRIKKHEGFGEYNLVNDCKDGVDCSEQAHQLNRRSVFKVLSMQRMAEK